MAQFRNLLKRCIPLFLVLVVLISLFPAVPSFAAEASSSDGGSITAGADISSGEVAAAADYTLSGVWVFKSSLSYSGDISQPVNFTSNGTSYSQMKFSEVENPILAFKLYYGVTAVCTNNSFTNSAYKTVDFGTTPQTVPSIFYNWFTSNATKQQTKTTYCVYVDGSLATSWSVADSSVELDLRVHEDSISVGFPEHDDEYYSVDYSGSPYLFGGMCKHDEIGCCDYMVSSSPYTITLSSSNPILYLTCAYKYPLYIDPNGGTWNGSSDISEFWEFAGTDTEEICDPVRPGYTFTGWTFTGAGEFNDVGDPPYNYEHDTAPGYLSANWVAEEVPAYTHIISIEGSSYTFTADNAAPPVQIQVLPAGISMTSGNITKSWTYSGADTFVGIQDSSGNTYDVGASFSLLGSSGSDKTSVLTPLTETPSQDTFTTLVKLYDSTGSTLLKSFLASSDAASPSATLAIGEKQLVFDSSALDSAITWNYTGEGSIAGISLTPNASSPTYTPGDTMTFGGFVGQSHVVSVYIVEDEVVDPTPDNVLTATFVIGGQSYVFTGTETALPEVTMDVLFGGVRLYDGTTSYFHENESILGYKLSEDAESYIAVGESHLFSARSISYTQTLFPVYSADLLFSATVNIYNSTGTQLLGSYDFSAQGSAPVVTLTVLGNGCKIVSGDTAYSWDSGSDPFYGFSPALYVAAPYYVPGNIYTLPGGDAVNLTIDLYVHDTESSGLPALDFVDWLKTAVGGFLDFEIFPGLALDEILYFILVVQLLLWFLKVIT